MNLEPNIPDPDAFYAALVAAHEGLSDGESADLDARLVFLLANKVGDARVLAECIALARSTGAAPPADEAA